MPTITISPKNRPQIINYEVIPETALIYYLQIFK